MYTICIQCLRRPEESAASPGSSRWLRGAMWLLELNLGPLEKQAVLFTVELLLYPLNILFLMRYVNVVSFVPHTFVIMSKNLFSSLRL